MQKCKLCLCPKKEEIENMIISGISYSDIADTLKAMGFSISPPSIRRHEINCMGLGDNENRQANKKFSSKEAIIPNNTAINIYEIIEETRKELEENNMLNLISSNMELSYLILLKISICQQATTLALMNKYISGNGKYPLDEIKGMKMIHDLTNNITTFNKLSIETYKSYPTKHLDRLGDIAYMQGYTSGQSEDKYVIGDMFKEDYALHNNPYEKYSFDELIDRQYREYENGYIEARG